MHLSEIFRSVGTIFIVIDENFKDILLNIHTYLHDLEQNLGLLPNIEITGDFNILDMKRWDQSEIDDILDKINRIEETVKSIGRVKTQIKYLYDFVQDWDNLLLRPKPH